MFIVGRAVAGIGGSGVVSGGLSVIAIVTPARQRPLFTGLMTSLYALGTVVAPIIGGSFTNYVTRRWCFLINLPAGAVTIVTLLLFYHPPEGASTEQSKSLVQKVKQLDLIGCALLIPSIIMLMLALEWGGEQYAWNSATIIGLFVGFAVEMIVFILWEIRTGEQAMIPFLLLGDQSVIFSILFAFFFMGSFVIPVYYLPEWFQIVKAASPIRSGVMLLPSICTQVAGSLVSGILGTFNLTVLSFSNVLLGLWLTKRSFFFFFSQVREILQSLVPCWVYTLLHRSRTVYYLYGFYNLIRPLDWISDTSGLWMRVRSPDASSHGPVCP